jgi:hypothetical protein
MLINISVGSICSDWIVLYYLSYNSRDHRHLLLVRPTPDASEKHTAEQYITTIDAFSQPHYHKLITRKSAAQMCVICLCPPPLWFGSQTSFKANCIK